MNEQETARGKSITSAIKSDAVSMIKEYIEFGVDLALEEGTLKDIPIVGGVVGVFSALGSVKDLIFSSKLVRFLNGLSEVPLEKRQAMINKLNADENFAGKTGTALIEILDRMESEIKPELAAKCFAAYAEGDISFIQLRRMLFALEKVPTFEIVKLEKFSEGANGKMEQATVLSYVNAGLAMNNGGLDGGSFIPTELCTLFISSGVLSNIHPSNRVM
ncbi:hypothetical protein [Vibrio parahaemolyticus]|uniref:hypothetical protein n=1 Tax=Vibrio parahaemolyticus TaxID=670 RepID=UPI001121756A|nr:hypothetical protein [Vibrio parahaemolyticus]TOI97358.1 hypothetical protein CGI48_24115 [Vibrio parahaemolyticus]